jgi:Ser/Thr protein kinase RdoA (MazF antagonist)
MSWLPSAKRGLAGARAREALEEKLLAAAQAKGKASYFRLSGPIVENQWAQIYYGTSDLYAAPVAVKLLRDPGAGSISPKDARESFLGLTAAAQSVQGDARCASVMPLDLFEDLAVVVTEWVDGMTLDRLLARSSGRKIEAILNAAGAWLSRLHQANARAPRPLDTGRLLSWLEKSHAAAAPRVKSKATEQAKEILYRTAGLAARRAVPWVLLHGDFKPSNLILAEGTLVGIDAQLMYDDAALIDAGYFLNHFGMDLFRHARLFSTSRLNGFERAFLQGYEREFGTSLPRLPLAWARLANALRLKAAFRGWSRPPKAYLTGWWLRRLIQSLSTELKTSARGETEALRDGSPQAPCSLEPTATKG